MTVIALNRRFFEWHDGKMPDPDFVLRYARAADSLSWDGIAARQRVVILAEAGSGKTEEMREQARLRATAGQFSFFATVEDVDRDGLDRALANAADTARLDEWRASDQPAWFFIDSIDEAKLGRVPFQRAIRLIADGIAGHERRAHIVLSCRLTDWESTRDLERLSKGLPIPHDVELPPPPSRDDELRRVLRHERIKERPPPEEPLVVLMAPLDPERVRLFASAKCVLDADAFLGQIEAKNLWRFARRPLDLGWLVDFWRSRGRLGSLAEMLESSLTAWVREPNPDRARGDSLDETRAVHAIERIGAALVFGRKATIAIPDSELLRPEDERPLDLALVLPDLSIQDRARLLSRPFFDPATFGRARLHNDNQGVVRGYLTARWLHRLRGGGNLSRGELFALLFATTYGIKLVKPSLMETTTWLALWEEDVGREIALRDPSLPLTAGDPASLSMGVREAVLTDVVEQLAADGPRLRQLDHDSVKRFVQPDMSNVIRRLWGKYSGHSAARDFLLRLIWLGQLTECAHLAESAAYGAYAERFTLIIAGRALVSAGDNAMKRRYANYVRANCVELPNAVVVDAIDGLFPDPLGVADLLDILAKIDITDADGGLSIEWQAPGWIDRVKTRAGLEEVLRGLLSQLGPEPQDIAHIADKREDAYYAAIATAAVRLLEHCRPDEAPIEAIDAALRLGLAYRFGQRPLRKLRDVNAELHRTSARRRLAFWRAAEQRNAHRWLNGQRIEHTHAIEFFGYPLGLRTEDIAWLLADAPDRAAENERRLAIDTAMRLWRDVSSPAEWLQRIDSVSQSDPAMRGVYEFWLNPPSISAEQSDAEQKWATIREQDQKDQAARDQSWVEFIGRLRKNPDELRNIPPPTADEVDTRLYHLWLLLCETVDASTRYAISSVAPMEPMLGREVAAAFRDALIKFWRHWKPKVKSQKTETERNQMSILDSMGICGISLEAASGPHWNKQLTSDDAALAAAYATLEINGFPSWLNDLAVAKPAEVRGVLLREVLAELDDPNPRSRYEVLEDISRAGSEIGQLMAPLLFADIKQHTGVAPNALGPLLKIVAEGLREKRAEFATLALERFTNATDARVSSLYLRAAFTVDPDAATAALTARLEQLNDKAQIALVQQILPGLFGTGLRADDDLPLPQLGFAALEKLVGIAFRTIRVEHDRNRPSGRAYSPDERDHAEQARGAAFNQLLATPGRATFAALLRFAENPDCPIPPGRLREFAAQRAAEDSESAAWLPGEVVAFEASSEAAPSSPDDLQRTALRRFDDMQQELLHDDFAQGPTVRLLQGESAVQNWMADRLRLKQGRSYSVERESHVADEKERDVRLRAKVTDASLAIEIKVAETWSVRELEAAVSEQLCGRYLRARNARYGILLLVHQRPKRWRDPDTGQSLGLIQLVERLRTLAQRIASETSDSPQPEIAVIDVSRCTTPKPSAAESKRMAKPQHKAVKSTRGAMRERKGAKGKRGSREASRRPGKPR